ncbi:MAG: carboxypeptidase regulatory-like domain-containing protein [Acidobacteria bacterium]|nr:carboxypeptidase regulatory-like domain-containing protein [Acidobacteriota bacterium]MCI0723443.1 carboxypeptidase regulatory-like domain-containing protein [Acidobacteriota bacterium]
MSIVKYCVTHRRIVLSRGILFMGLLLVVPVSWSQINTGRIIGSIFDASGAAIPGVEVRATNEETGVVTTTQSVTAGDYLLNFLVPGKYRVEAEKEGFQKAVQLGVIVNAGGIARIDTHMVVGEIRQTVEVTINPIAVSTETSELSQTFSAKELDRLPNIDRNPLYQMNLMPGANNDRGSGNNGTNGGENGSAIGQTRMQLASLGGTQVNTNSVFIEGTYNREAQNAYIAVLPPMEAVQEIQVYTGKYNAEYGFSGSAVVNVVTRSGTNELHGAAFEFLRNHSTDARNFFDETKTPFRRNQFGGAIGGPIKKNKLFFFADYQGTYLRTSDAGITSAPTDRMYKGDFSELYDPSHPPDGAGNTWGQLYDPFTRKFDAQGKVIGATPFPGNIIPRDRWDAVSGKMNDDFVFGKANRPGIESNLYHTLRNAQTVHQADGRLDYNHSEKDRFFFRYSNLKATLDYLSSVNRFWQGGEADSDTLNQNMQLTYLRTFSPSKMNEFRVAYNRTNVTTSAKSMEKEWNNFYGMKNGNLGDPITQGIVEFTGLDPIHNIGDPDWVAFIIGNTISATENFTWVKRRHNMKFGTNINWLENTSADTIGGDSPRGTLGFDAAMTSYDGNAAPYAYPSFLLGTMVSSSRARFVNGWPYQTYWQNAWYAQDDFKVLPSLTLNLGLRYELITRPIERFNRQSNWDIRTNQLVVATKDNRSPALQLDKNDWGPRVGFAWTPDQGKTSLRGGYGISYWTAYQSGPLTILGLTYPNYAKDVFLAKNNLTPSLSLQRDGIPIAAAHYDPSGNLIIPDGALIRGVDYAWRNQRVDQTSLNLEREIRPGMIMDIGYLSVRGRYNNHKTNINLAPPGPANEDFNLRRPLHDKYPGLGDVPIQFSAMDSYYDALTARLTANISKYIFLNASYAHGRNFSPSQGNHDSSNIDPNNINQYYGPTPQDIPHIFNAQAVFELPVGRGQAVLANMNPVLDHILGGWQYSGLIHLRSGTRFGVTSPVSRLNNGQGNRPDRIKDGNLPSGERTLERWYDTTAFVNHLEAQTYGNAGSNPLFADGQAQLDSSFFKTFKITERQALQFRVDMFNTFNHPDFNPPRARVGSSSNGRVTSTSIDGRRMQFGLRYSF